MLHSTYVRYCYTCSIFRIGQIERSTYRHFFLLAFCSPEFIFPNFSVDPIRAVALLVVLREATDGNEQAPVRSGGRANIPVHTQMCTQVWWRDTTKGGCRGKQTWGFSGGFSMHGRTDTLRRTVKLTHTDAGQVCSHRPPCAYLSICVCERVRSESTAVHSWQGETDLSVSVWSGQGAPFCVLGSSTFSTSQPLPVFVFLSSSSSSSALPILPLKNTCFFCHVMALRWQN